VDYPNRKTLTIREVEEIQAIQEATKEETEDKILVTSNVSQLLVIWRALQVQEATSEPSQR